MKAPKDKWTLKEALLLIGATLGCIGVLCLVGWGASVSIARSEEQERRDRTDGTRCNILIEDEVMHYTEGEIYDIIFTTAGYKLYLENGDTIKGNQSSALICIQERD